MGPCLRGALRNSGLRDSGMGDSVLHISVCSFLPLDGRRLPAGLVVPTKQFHPDMPDVHKAGPIEPCEGCSITAEVALAQTCECIFSIRI